MTIRLLVSVRDAVEAKAAVEGGADIVDVKEPRHGALGFAGVEIVQDVVTAVQHRVPVSVALGEIADWSAPRGDHGNGLRGIQFAKLGPIADRDDSCDRWSQQWMKSRKGVSLDSAAEWVAVSYADADRAGVPEPEEILRQASNCPVAVFLIDTCVKDDQCVFDVLSMTRLLQLRRQAQTAGLQFALAGQIRTSHLPLIRELMPDIVGVRGAVCDGVDRTSTLRSDRVRALKNDLRELSQRSLSVDTQEIQS